MTNKMTNDELNSFFKKVARSESYDKGGNNVWGFNKGVRATLIALGYDENWIETIFRDKYENFISTTNSNKK